MLDTFQIGIKIKKLREENNLSQEELAEKLFLSRQAISKWERGISVPNVDLIITLSKLFKTSIDEILCLNDSPQFDINNIFACHSREYIIDSIISGKVKVDIINVIDQMTQIERVRIIKAISEDLILCNKMILRRHLLISEQKLLNVKKEK